MDTNSILGLVGIFGAIIIVVIQQMYPTIPKYVGWPIVGILLIVSVLFISPKHISLPWEISLIVCIVIFMSIISILYWRTRIKVLQSVKDTNSPLILLRSRKDQAKDLHKEIMRLDSSLERKKDELSKDEDWKQNPEIRDLLDKLQQELSELGYLVNNRDYDRWAEAMMSLHSRKLEFHMKERESYYDEWGRARINAKLRDYIKKVKD